MHSFEGMTQALHPAGTSLVPLPNHSLEIPMRNLLLLTAGLAAAAPVTAQTALLREGDPAPSGSAGTTIEDLRACRVNQSGGFAVSLNSDSAAGDISSIWGNFAPGVGALLDEESTIGNFVQTAFDAEFGMTDSALCYVATVDDVTGSFNIDSVWFDGAVVALEDGLSPDGINLFSFFTDAGVTSGGVPHFVAGITDTGGFSGRGLYTGTTPATLYVTGDMIPNMGFPLSGSAVDFDFKFSANGTHNMVEMDLDTGSSTNDRALSIDGSGLFLGGLLTREEQPVPASIGGLPGENWDNFDGYAITESGTYYFTGDTDATETADEFIVRNGVIWHREGDVIDGQTVEGAIEASTMSENDVLAYIWDVSDGAGSLEALFVEETLIALEGDPVDWDGDGSLDPGAIIAAFTSNVAVGSDGRVYFTADIEVGGQTLEGFFVADGVPGATNFCMANANSTGSVATLVASGSGIVANNNLVLTSASMPSQSFGFFIASVDQGFVMNPGGSAGNLCLSGSIGRYVGPGQIQNTGSTGEFSLAIDLTAIPTPTGPVGAVPGDIWNFQAWYRDFEMGAATSNFTPGLEVVLQ